MTVVNAPTGDEAVQERRPHPTASTPDDLSEPTEVLFPEARRRERRRRLLVLVATILVFGGTGLEFALSHGKAGPRPHHAVRVPLPSIPKALALPTGAVVNLQAPSALAVS